MENNKVQLELSVEQFREILNLNDTIISLSEELQKEKDSLKNLELEKKRLKTQSINSLGCLDLYLKIISSNLVSC